MSAMRVFRDRLDPGRAVAGAVLAIVGAAIAWQLVRAIVTNRASTHAAWVDYLPVLIVFGTLSLAFMVPGAMLLLYRRSVGVDLEKREVIERRSYLGYTRTRRDSLASFTTIVLARRQTKRRRAGTRVGSSRSRRSYPYFVVELAPERGTPLPIVTDAKEETARAAAIELAALTRLPVHDEVAQERAREAAGVDEDGEAD
jgi:hypothetical protein